MPGEIYLVSVTVKAVEIDTQGIGRVNPNRSISYFKHTEKIGDVYDILSDVADDFDKITLGVK